MDIKFYLKNVFNKSTGKFETVMYTNLAENVYMDVDSEKTLRDVITEMNIKIDEIASGQGTHPVPKRAYLGAAYLGAAYLG